jgi:hypothetical protein
MVGQQGASSGGWLLLIHGLAVALLVATEFAVFSLFRRCYLAVYRRCFFLE